MSKENDHIKQLKELGGYPLASIVKHAIVPVPYLDLDVTVEDATIEYQNCYALPCEWIDQLVKEYHRENQLTKGENNERI